MAESNSTELNSINASTTASDEQTSESSFDQPPSLPASHPPPLKKPPKPKKRKTKQKSAKTEETAEVVDNNRNNNGDVKTNGVRDEEAGQPATSGREAKPEVGASDTNGVASDDAIEDDSTGSLAMSGGGTTAEGTCKRVNDDAEDGDHKQSLIDQQQQQTPATGEAESDDEPQESTPLVGSTHDESRDVNTPSSESLMTPERESSDRLAAWFEAVVGGDSETLRWLLDSGLSVNSRDEVGVMRACAEIVFLC